MDSYLLIFVFCTFSVATIWAHHKTPAMGSAMDSDHQSPFMGMVGSQVARFGGIMTKGDCPHFKPQAGFNATRLAGTWYVYEGNRPGMTAGMKCGELHFDLKPNDNLDLRISAIREMTMLGFTVMKVRIKLHGDLVHTEGTSFSLSFSGYHDLDHANYNIVDTDYDSYVVVHNCYKFPMMPVSMQVASIFTRQRGVAPEALDKIKVMLGDHHVDVSKFHKMDNADCTCPYEEKDNSEEDSSEEDSSEEDSSEEESSEEGGEDSSLESSEESSEEASEGVSHERVSEEEEEEASEGAEGETSKEEE